MKTLSAIAEDDGLAPIDLHFAELMRRRAGASADAEVVAATAALLSRERGRGHSCIDLGDWAGRPLVHDRDGAPGPALPGRGAWERELDRSGLAGGPGDATPLVRDGAGRVYLRRYFDAEQRIAEALRGRLRRPPPEPDGETSARIEGLFRELFPAAGSPQPDGQAAAAAAALRGAVTLVSGGPGTGKTTTVARILALLRTAEPELRVALAAPTGKAASRLGESIAAQLETLPIAADLRARIPSRAATLHRLLGYLPRDDRFRRHPGRPLAVDLLVIDEASMVDLLLMDAALAALPESARVVLLGDRDQLASVETGSVFGDLCAAAGLDQTAAGTGEGAAAGAGQGAQPCAPTKAATPLAAALHGSAVELRTSYRFGGRSGIGELARSIREQDAGAALDVLADAGRSDVHRRDPPRRRDGEDPRAVLAPIADDLDGYLDAGSPAEALRRLGRFRVLCAAHRGPWGVEDLVARVESLLLRRGVPVGDPWYHGRPILITANDYQVRLFNGDLGICWADGDGLAAWFPDEPGPRRLPLARVPAHATAWAMTVHKSQGSEFDRVLLTLPESDMPLLTRELLYTGVTRARERLWLVAEAGVLRAAIGRRGRRASGLIDALLGAEPPPPSPAVEPQPPPSPAEPRQLSLF
jgi:exodeoxyribonuclease V alpha subunit